jgi:hypothetical protein
MYVNLYVLYSFKPCPSFLEIFQAIYDLYVDVCEYVFSNKAKRLYVEYSNKLSDMMNKQWNEAGVCTDNVSKDKNNFIR